MSEIDASSVFSTPNLPTTSSSSSPCFNARRAEASNFRGFDFRGVKVFGLFGLSVVSMIVVSKFDIRSKQAG